MNSTAVFLLALSIAAADAAYEPTSHYTVEHIEGWKVYVNNRLLQDEHKAAGGAAIALLQEELAEIVSLVQPEMVEKLRATPIWLELDNTKHNPCACYHVDADWLRENGFNPEKVRCVEISNAKTFCDWIKTQPMMILHELAHGYHHQQLGYDDASILKLFEKAKQSGAYEAVRRYDENGKTVRHYALNSPMEYFAEATEAYFGRNDYFPFVREELRRHDPELYQRLEEIWGKQLK